MNNSIEQVLGALNLGLDLPLLKDIIQTVSYMEEQHLCLPIKELEAIAVAALVSQNKRLLAVDNHTIVSAGLSIQNFLNHLCLQNRELFLQLVYYFSLKWHLCSQVVKQKIIYLKKVYCLYLSYHRAFMKIAMAEGLQVNLSQALSALFWLAYIQRGRKVKIMNEQDQQQRMLMNYVEWVFVSFFRLGNSEEKDQLLQIAKSRIQLTQLQEVQSQIIRNLQNISQANKANNFRTDNLKTQLLENNIAELLLYEYTKNFAQKYEVADSMEIKFTHFFTLSKSLSPRPRPRKYQSQQATVHSISQRLQFQQQEEEMIYWRFSQEGTPSESNLRQGKEADAIQQKQIPNQKQQAQFIFPCNLWITGKDRLSALNWVNKTMNMKGGRFKKCQTYFRNAFNQDFAVFFGNKQKTIQKFLTIVAPECMQVQNKSKKILTVFQNFMAILLEKNTDQKVRTMFCSTKNFDGFIFISVLLVACAYKVNLVELTLCLKEFQISPEEAFVPINWIGNNADLPKCLQIYIIQIEKVLLLRQIWRDGRGFQMLEKNQKQKVTYLQKSLMKRMKMHIKILVKQICSDKLQLSESVFSIMNQVEKKCLKVFRFNSIEAVIVAAFELANLTNSIEQTEKSALKAWKKTKHYLNNFLSFFDLQGNRISFSTFSSELSKMMDFKALEQNCERKKRAETFFILGESNSTLSECEQK